MISIFSTKSGQPTPVGKSRTNRVPASETSKTDPSEILKTMEHWIGHHPSLCAGLAMAVGVIIGCLVKRR
jgi:ElaB/YqjD/DUF883 family membrane-anchored ribosome-binding protein